MRTKFILFYGAAVAALIYILMFIGNWLSGWGDGAPQPHGQAPLYLSVLPVGVFFVGLAVSRYKKEKKKNHSRLLLILAHIGLLASAFIIGGFSDGLFFALFIFVLSIPAVVVASSPKNMTK